MLQRSLVVAFIAVPLLGTPLTAQNRPDFSGTWTLVPQESTLAGSAAFGTEFTASQDSTNLTLDLPLTRFDNRVPGGTFEQLADRVRIVVDLDGSEMGAQLLNYVFAWPFFYEPDPTPSRRKEWVSRATWTGDKLVIVTHNTLEFTDATCQLKSRQTVWQALSFDFASGGTLVVESVIIAEPLPGMSRPQDSPTPVRSVYRRSS